MKRFMLYICIVIFVFGGMFNTSAAYAKDTTPPAIISSSPSAGQINIGIDIAFTVKYKEAIYKGISFSKIILLDNNKKSIPISASIKSDILTATLKDKLSWFTEYTLIIPAGALKDRAGNSPAKPYTIKFRTVPMPLSLREELKQVTTGITKLSVSYPGALELSSKEWIPIAAADNTVINTTFSAARKYGKGRILALGKEEILINDNIYILDNLKFLRNAFNWLNSNRSKRVGYSTGHGEFIDDYALAKLRKELEKDKYIISPASLTADSLKNKDILIIGNAWRNFSQAEISAVEKFVTDGGSLILAGLGWSYFAYNPNTVYPMDTLSSNLGVKWAKATISDTPEMYKASPVFNALYPNIKSQDIVIKDAMDFIRNTTIEHASDLATVLQNNSIIYNKYAASLMLLAEEISSDNALKQKKYEFFKTMVINYPQYYSKEPIFDSNLYPNITWLREHFIKAWIDAQPLTTVSKAEIAHIAKINGNYKKIWDDFGVYIADNNILNTTQMIHIYKTLQLIPRELHSTRIISAAEHLGNRPTELKPFIGLKDGTNIFKLSVGEISENSFPADISEGVGDFFTLVLVHEINHMVDSKTIEQNITLGKRKTELINNAGQSPNNYLRSMFESGFFTNAPQEFFASISNQWFVDSAKTIKLGLLRFDKGTTQPINQALFFAEVYSQGENSTYFYNSDSSGNITRTEVPLVRDEKGRIKVLVFGGYRYDFTLNNNGDITSYSAIKM